MPRLLLLLVLAWDAHSDVIPETRALAAQNQFAQGEQQIHNYQKLHGTTPESLEALSWLGRDALAAKHLDDAERYARETYREVQGQLHQHPLQSDKHLALALGAAIEVQGQVLAQRGERGAALDYLHKQLTAYHNTPIRARIQKNINLLSLEGKPAPELQEHEHLGPAPRTLAQLKGHPVLLFFWAHWCGDCKYESRQVAQVKAEFASKGLVVMGPTQRYGYVAAGQDANPQQETKYIDEIRNKYYNGLLDMPVPLSEENLKVYGVSTTPTLVLIDRHGVVRLYRPGRITSEELKAAVKAVV